MIIWWIFEKHSYTYFLWSSWREYKCRAEQDNINFVQFLSADYNPLYDKIEIIPEVDVVYISEVD